MNIFNKLKATRQKPVHIIHGTDWWTDCDDVASLRLLCRAHKAGLIVLEGVALDAVMDFSAPSVSAFLSSEGLGEIPIGVDFKAKHPVSDECRYQEPLARLPKRINSNAECESAVTLYRRVLANCAKKCDITEVGFPQNIMYLLKSEPDEISELAGVELVRQKVNKIWMMAGKWDENGGREYNLSAYPIAAEAGSYICEHCPVPVTFLGFEVGESVITGGSLPEGDLVGEAYRARGFADGRCSWDPMLTLAAIVNDESEAGYDNVKGKATVDAQTGKNYFEKTVDGSHTYLVKNKCDGYYAAAINELLVY